MVLSLFFCSIARELYLFWRNPYPYFVSSYLKNRNVSIYCFKVNILVFPFSYILLPPFSFDHFILILPAFHRSTKPFFFFKSHCSLFCFLICIQLDRVDDRHHGHHCINRFKKKSVIYCYSLINFRITLHVQPLITIHNND